MMKRRQVDLVVWALVMTLMAAEPAAASLDGSLQAIIGILKGPVARSCAIIAVMIIAYKMLFGHADPIKFGTVALAIGILFGAAELVDTTIAS
jgi:type IV secretory pathway VirB2 component (pilin)